ncbi:hypothetical protein I3F58_27225 [Streptomyces sp. MUM 203J]|uniref:hypothetical protein n=1 Tax=Streptomyces sp. MUM 203J TaxID=2791990 RepID=UPI001F03DA5B|nr:hypothetical protein [Streptomyces sp. MUM 203J]MCH0543178.1 hypothetical protein [Streptomyces sp. MUM 203J]
MMTIKVYARHRDGTVTTVRERREVAPVDSPPTTTGFPPCSCPPCRRRQEASR